MNLILIPILYTAKIGLNIIYFFIKLFTKQKNKVTMLSRQSNNINIDFRLLKEEIEKKNENSNGNNSNIEIKILCKMIPKTLWGKIQYCFYMIKCLYHIATSKICIIDGYNIAISSLKHKKNLKVVQIWHATGAIKKFGYQVLGKEEGSNKKIAKIMKMHANYNMVTCTSEATRKIYSEAFNTDIEKIKVLGMPRIDYILGKNNEINEKIAKLYEEYPKLKEKKNIVYVPTFRKDKVIDIDKIIDNINTEKYNLIIRLHPLDKNEVKNEYKVDKKYSTSELIKIADYVITDYSAVAFEAATLDKPLFFYLYDIDEYVDIRGLNINLQEEMKDSTSSNIIDLVDMIENNTYNCQDLRKFKEKYVQTADTNNTKRIVEYIMKSLEKMRGKETKI